jgi:biopolymer transport protein TolR
MSSPRRQRQREAQRRAGRRAVALNLVSLIDVFAILVFYLLVCSLDPEVLTPPATLQLPTAQGGAQPQVALSIVVGVDEIRVDEHVVLRTAQAESGDAQALAALAAALAQPAGAVRPPVQILADRAVSYRVLRAVMAVCAAGQYGDIALAVSEDRRGAGA